MNKISFMNKNNRVDRYSLAFAVICQFLYVLGMVAYDHVISEKMSIHALELAALVLISFPVAVLVYIAASKTYSQIDKITSKTKESPKTYKDILKSKGVRNLIVILICWLPFMIIRFPGNYDPDTVTQLLQSHGLLAKSDHHPFFDTVIYDIFWKVGSLLGSNKWSLFLYATLQMITTALVFVLIIAYMEWRGIPRIIRQSLFLFYAVCPIIPLFTQTMAKDMTHGGVFTLFCLIYIEIIQSRGLLLKNRLICVSTLIISLMVIFTKKTGLIIIIPLILAVFYIKNKRKTLATLIIVILFISALWSKVLLKNIGVSQGPIGEILSMPSQHIAYHIKYHSDEMTEEDWEILSKVYWGYQDLGTAYDPVRADTTKGRWIEDNGNEKEFIKWYIKFALKNPDEIILASSALDYPLLCVDMDTEGDESLIFYRDNIPYDEGVGSGNESWIAHTTGDDNNIEEVHQMLASSYRPIGIKRVSYLYDTFLGTVMKIIPLIFSKILYATWIPLFVVFYLFRSRNKTRLISMTPLLLNTMILFLICPIILPRYMVNSVYTAPLLLMQLFIPDSISMERMIKKG